MSDLVKNELRVLEKVGGYLDNTKYQFCKVCEETQHSCVGCGNIFTCKCEPCHEGVDDGKVARALDYWLWSDVV